MYEFYLAIDSCQTACAGLRLTKASAVTSAGLPGEAQGVELPLLLAVYAFHPCCQQKSLSLSGRVWMKEASVLHVSVTHMDVII